MWFMPESPRWLVQKDRQEEALQVLAQVHAGGDVNDAYVQAELAEIVAKISFEKNHPPPSYYDMLIGTHRRRMWIGIGVVCPPQVCYHNLNTNRRKAILAIDDGN
jgi:hypothetical protein